MNIMQAKTLQAPCSSRSRNKAGQRITAVLLPKSEAIHKGKLFDFFAAERLGKNVSFSVSYKNTFPTVKNVYCFNSKSSGFFMQKNKNSFTRVNK